METHQDLFERQTFFLAVRCSRRKDVTLNCVAVCVCECDKRDKVVTHIFFASSKEKQYLLQGVFRIYYLLKNADSLACSLP